MTSLSRYLENGIDERQKLLFAYGHEESSKLVARLDDLELLEYVTPLLGTVKGRLVIPSPGKTITLEL